MDMTVGNDYSATLEEMKQRLEVSKKRYSAVKKNITKKKAKKKLKYNSREVAAQLARATRSIGASMALISASDKLASLQKLAVTGDYDMNEVRAAITHARSMVRCARMKKNHLLAEENLEREGKKKNGENNISKEQKVQQLVQRELKKMRRKNRAREKGKIEAAQMRYQREKSNAARYAEERQAYAEAYREAYRRVCQETAGAVDASGAGSVDMSAAASIDVTASAEATPAASIDICV